MPAARSGAGLLLVLAAVGCGGGSRTGPAPVPPAGAATAGFSPAVSSRWWEQPSPCPPGAALQRDAAPGQPVDACDLPLCEVYCARADGTRHGPVTGWYRGDGKKHHEGSYRDGVRDGVWVVWYLAGDESDRGRYRRGDKDGTWKQWWEGGEPYRLAEYRQGKLISITPFRDGEPQPTEYVDIEGAGVVAPQPIGDAEAAPQPEPAPQGPRPGPEQALSAVRSVFPESYAELATVSYERAGDEFVIASVTVLVPEAKVTRIQRAELATRACAAKRSLDLDCACETVDLGPAEDYAWHSWPDKRVVPMTVKFMIGC